MKLDLVDSRLDLSGVPYLVDLSDGEVGDTNGPDLSFLYQSLHRSPCFDYRDVNDIYAKCLLINGKALSIVDTAERNGPVDL